MISLRTLVNQHKNKDGVIQQIRSTKQVRIVGDSMLPILDPNYISVLFITESQKYEVGDVVVFENKNSNYLGEVALVPYDSPISNTGLVFNTTLFDENAACHLALGDGFPKSFKNYKNMSDDEIYEKGINSSNIHVDFMIGTSDLEIEAETKEGKILIFKNGNFNI